MRHRLLTIVMLAMAIFGAGDTTYLTIEAGRGGSPFCVVGHGCEVVAQSSLAHIGPIPSATIGLLGYLLLALAFAMRLARPPVDVDRLLIRATFGMALFGFGVSAFLTYVSLFDLHAVCTWCIGSAINLTLMAIGTGYVFVSDLREPELSEDSEAIEDEKED